MSKVKKILLYGPPTKKVIELGYGGGTGGYTRNMNVYLNFTFDGLNIVPLFHTVRGEINLGKISCLVIRAFIDLKRILVGLFIDKPDAIHILAQYRLATKREYVLALCASLVGIQYLYEIKAGEFISFYKNTNILNRYFIRYIIKNAKVVLGEGEIYTQFLKDEFDKKCYFLPNFVQSTEIPTEGNITFKNEILHVIFVGYCMRAKGVFELIEGAIKLTNESKIKVKITLIGGEDREFKNYMDNLAINKFLVIDRRGRLEHKYVLQHLRKNDIYCYPTSHKGEGHNNSINEAMMFGLAIVTSKSGFLDKVLDSSSAYFLNEINSTEINNTLHEIYKDKHLARQKGKNARDRLISSYTSDVVYNDFVKYYRKLTH